MAYDHIDAITWSACSKEDLDEYYNEVMNDQGRFCLEKIRKQIKEEADKNNKELSSSQSSRIVSIESMKE